MLITAVCWPGGLAAVEEAAVGVMPVPAVSGTGSRHAVPCPRTGGTAVRSNSTKLPQPDCSTAHRPATPIGAGIAEAIGIVGNLAAARCKRAAGRRINSATLLAEALRSLLDAPSSAGHWPG